MTEASPESNGSRYHSAGVNPRLAAEEDAELRTIHMLQGFGNVAGTVSSRYEALRDRDRRGKVRDPDDAKVATPVEKSAWGDRKSAAMKPAPVPEPISPAMVEPVEAAAPVSSAAERVISDTREIFGELPQSRRGLGVFRR